METKTTRCFMPDLEAALEKKFEKIEQRLPISAVANAEKKQPPLSNEDIGAFFGEFHFEYQEAILMINDFIQTNNLEANRIKDNEQTKDDVAELQNQYIIAKEQQLQKDGNAQILKLPFAPLRQSLAWAAVATLSLFEGLMNRPSFSAYGYNLLEALGMSVAFAALLMVFSHSFERIVRKGKTIWQQRAVAIGLLVFLATVFWYLAEVRAKYLSAAIAENSGDASISFSPIPFTLLSVLLFIASVVICHFFLPNREQRSTMRDYRQHVKEQQNRADKIAQLEAAIKSKEAANDELNRVHNSLQEYGAMLEHRVITRAKLGLQLWMKHNFLHRTDGRPKSFDNTEYPFKFTTFFHHVNLM
jgi:hypothetical protein